MKTIYLIALCLMATLTFAQGNSTADDENKNSAGDELILASKTYYAGIITSFVGVSAAIIGQQAYKDDSNDTEEQLQWKADTRRTFAIVGYGLAGIGVVVQITAFSHIGKAGRKLNATVGSAGIGLAYKF